MSADNTICIRKIGDDYKVAMLYGFCWDYMKEAEIDDLFKDSKPYPTLEAAEERAEEWLDEIEAGGGYVEYGIEEIPRKT